MSVLPKIQRSHVIISEEIREFCDTVLLKTELQQVTNHAPSAIAELRLQEAACSRGRDISRRSGRERRERADASHAVLRMIEDVEELRAKLQALAFDERKLLAEDEVKVVDSFRSLGIVPGRAGALPSFGLARIESR